MERVSFRTIVFLVMMGCVVFTPAVQAGDLIVVESKTVTPGETGVTLDISLENDNPINALTIPFLVRTVAGELFWTNVPASLDTLPWYGRIDGTMTSLRFLNTTAGDLDGNSPDQFMIAAQRIFDPATPPGALEPVITFTFDVNSSIGQFEFDTGLFPPNNILLYVDDNTFTEVYPEFTKGVITIPWGGAEVVVESGTVTTGTTGYEIGIRIASDDPLQRITLPLICRNVSGSAFWDNVPASLDTLEWTGRLTSALTHSRTLDKSEIDGISPDPFFIEAFNDADPALAPGPLEEMITLTFDIGDDEGSFEIDTGMFAPLLAVLEVETPGDPGVLITPEFTKGIITAELPDTGNKVTVGSITVTEGTPAELSIEIITQTEVASIVFPLVARTVSGGAFWAADLDTLPWQLVPADALGGNRTFTKFPGFDYVSPDNLFLQGARSEGFPMLDASAVPAYIRLSFVVNHGLGTFEVDTTFLPPVYTLQFGVPDGGGPSIIVPTFTKGIVTIEGCDCPNNGDLNCDGLINPFDVVLMVNFVYKGEGEPCDPGHCPYNGDLNCNDAINPQDVVVLVEYVYKGIDNICDPCTIH